MLLQKQKWKIDFLPNELKSPDLQFKTSEFIINNTIKDPSKISTNEKASTCDKFQEYKNGLIKQLESFYWPEVRFIYQNFEVLNNQQRKQVATLKCEDYYNYIQRNPISCIGCNNKISEMIREIFQDKKQSEIFEKNQNFSIKQNTIMLRKHILQNKNKFALTINEFLLNNEVEESCDKCSIYSVLQKNTNVKKFKKDRCLLHSNKIIPHSLWISCIKNLLTSNEDLTSVCQFQQSEILVNLQAHIKARKFCLACKDNILCAYKNMKQEQQTIRESDQVLLQHEQQYLDTSKALSENNQGSRKQSYLCYRERFKSLDIIDYDNYQESERSQTKSDNQDSEQSSELISYLTYDSNKKIITIPSYSNIIFRLLQKAEEKKLLYKHASTSELAEQEVLICIGKILKQRLQKYWKQKQSNETIFKLFTYISIMILIENFTSSIEQKRYKLKKNSKQEECSNEEDEKLKKKLEKRKQQKKKKKAKKEEQNKSESEIIKELLNIIKPRMNLLSEQQLSLMNYLGWTEHQTLEVLSESQLSAILSRESEIIKLKQIQRINIQYQYNNYMLS